MNAAPQVLETYKLTCPHCRAEFRDGWERFVGHENSPIETTCLMCGNPFWAESVNLVHGVVTVAGISYRTAISREALTGDGLPTREQFVSSLLNFYERNNTGPCPCCAGRQEHAHKVYDLLAGPMDLDEARAFAHALDAVTQAVIQSAE